MIEITGVADTHAARERVGFRAHEILSTPLDEAVLDYHVLGTSVDDEGQTVHRILLVDRLPRLGRPHARGDRRREPRGGRHRPRRVRAATRLASTRASRRPEPSPSVAIIAVSIDHDLTTLAISDGFTCHFTRVLEWGTANVDLALVPHAQGDGRGGRRASPGHLARGRPGYAAGLRPQPTEVIKRRAADARARAARIDPLLRLAARRSAGTRPRRLGIARRHPRVRPAARDPISGCPSAAADPFGRVELGPDIVRPERSDGLVVAVGLGIED